MTVKQPLLRALADDGIRLYHNKSVGARKALIVLTSPYLLVRHLNGSAAKLEEECRPKEILDYTEMFITSFCNLKCKYCSASIPYYLNKYHVDLDLILRQEAAYLEAIDGVDTFRILGGEPFLHPQLAQIMKPLIDSPKVNKLRLVTNGAIVPKDPAVLELLKNPKVTLDISNYGDVSDKVPLLKKMEAEGKLHLNIGPLNHWFMPNHKYKDLGMSDEAIAERFHSCPDYCHVLRDGKFYSCGEAFHIAHIPDSPMVCGRDYVDLFDDSMTLAQRRQMIIDVAFKRLPTMVGCNRCGGGSFIYKDRIMVAGEQPKPGEVVTDFELPADIPVVSTQKI